ncbi:hypothetical protein MRS44_009651 [Fusarium solani]|uniref:uncharacterized protein n=1 Tax=Fusarium solani TaxID=169388 RepID=UPI0032C45EA6|nr:hypothetical protein MRS44_009651 [Fusarium solani]
MNSARGVHPRNLQLPVQTFNTGIEVAGWADLFSAEPIWYLGLALTIDLALSKGRLPVDTDFPRSLRDLPSNSSRLTGTISTPKEDRTSRSSVSESATDSSAYSTPQREEPWKGMRRWDATKRPEFQYQRVPRTNSKQGQGKSIANDEDLSRKTGDSPSQSILIPEQITVGNKELPEVVDIERAEEAFDVLGFDGNPSLTRCGAYAECVESLLRIPMDESGRVSWSTY